MAEEEEAPAKPKWKWTRVFRDQTEEQRKRWMETTRGVYIFLMMSLGFLIVLFSIFAFAGPPAIPESKHRAHDRKVFARLLIIVCIAEATLTIIALNTEIGAPFVRDVREFCAREDVRRGAITCVKVSTLLAAAICLATFVAIRSVPMPGPVPGAVVA